MRVDCSGEGIDVDDALRSLLQRVAVGPFEAREALAPRLVVRAAQLPPQATAFDGNLGGGRFSLDGDVLAADFERSPLGAEAVLRLAWDIVTERLGGVMLHASAVAVGNRALVVTGQSGTGKTTIARHALAAGATLLSDEIVQLLPGGLCVGTPFRSDQRLSGCPVRARVAALATIVKGSGERWEPWSPAEAVTVARAQVFRRPGAPVGPLTSRLMVAVGGVATGRLACRDHPDAGRFVVDWLTHGR